MNASFGEVSSVNMAPNIALFAIIRRIIFYSVFMSMCKIPFLKSRNGQICSYLHMCIHVHTDCIFIIINVHLQIKIVLYQTNLYTNQVPVIMFVHLGVKMD